MELALSRRLRRRLIRHHAPAATVSVGATATIALLTSGETAFRLSIATAYVSLALLSLTLLIGPVRVLRGRRGALSSDLRRDIGIWAALVGIAHVAAGLLVHMGGRPWLYFSEPLRRFGFANYTGLVATVILAMLLALSNDLSIGRLGGQRWKSLHRLNYALFPLVVIHGAVYQWLESRVALLVAVLGLTAMAVITLQVAGFRAIQARRVRALPPSP